MWIDRPLKKSVDNDRIKSQLILDTVKPAVFMVARGIECSGHFYDIQDLIQSFCLY